MAATASTSSAKSTGPRGNYRLKVNSFDRTATLLIALLVMVGTSVLGLCIVFFANKFATRIEPIMVVLPEATSPNANQGLADEPDPPGIEEAPDLSEPQLQDALEALTEAVADNQAMLADQSIDAAAEAGRGSGLGDARQAGPGGDGVVERVPRWERWKFRFEPKSLGDFSAWLDQYKIMVGVLGRDNKVYVASGFSQGAPKVESGDPVKYGRLGRTIPSDGPMPALVKQLATKAGIISKGRHALLFFPFEVETLLYTKEHKYSGGRSANEIRQTVFTVIEKRGSYEFEVIEQRYF
ncbi:hypothetical protein OAS39_01990 [Pirellulales bacterium]|nr:hypothetical protein [Pirellulales bacterium]